MNKLVLFCGLLVFGFASALHAATDLIGPSRPGVIILPAGNSNGEVRGAAKLLQKYIQQSTGNRLEIVVDGQSDRSPRLYVGRSAAVDHMLNVDWKPSQPDAFVIDSKDGRVIIAGATPTGTWCGAAEFLRRHLGVRWYMPGQMWEVVPIHGELVVPDGRVIVEPDFLSRFHSGHRKPVEHQWLRIHGQRHLYDFHHAALRWTGKKVIDQYRDKPELFSQVRGRRMVPGVNSMAGWQLCMSNSQVFDIYAQMARDYFDRAPHMLSFSVSPNDGGSWCECAPCARLSARGDSTDEFSSQSALVFNMVNEVAKRLAKTHPDKLVGILGYSDYRMPVPGLKVEPNVVVYQVGCRSTYGKPEIRKNYHASFKAWQAAGVKHFGMYEWHHGSFFTVPVMYTRLLARAMRDGKENGVDGWYSEDYPAWGLQGPSHWIVRRLLWDVDQDVDELLDEYCRDLFGPAAQSMRSYFDLCEKHWADYGGGGGMGSSSQFRAYTPESFDALQKLLDEALKQTARHEPQHTRVQFFASTFGLSRRMATQHRRAQLALEQLEANNISGAFMRLAGTRDPFDDPMLYLKLVLDRTPLAHYYQSGTVDRHFTASESDLLRAKVTIVDRLVGAMQESVRAQQGVDEAQLQAIVQRAAASVLPTAASSTQSLLRAEFTGLAGKHILIRRAESGVTIDGKLDDSIWQSDGVESFLTHGSGRPARHRTQCRLAWDDQKLYLAARCYQNMTKPKAAAGTRDGKTWLDDAVELHFNLPPALEPTDNAVVIINVDGQIFDMKRGKPTWDANVQCATERYEDHWTLEASIPWRDLDLDPQRLPALRLNFVRDAWGAYTGGEIGSWFPTISSTLDLNIRGWGLLERSSRSR